MNFKILPLFLCTTIMASCELSSIEGDIDPVQQQTTTLETYAETEQFTSSSEAEIAHDFNALFTRYGNGWTGGDGTITIPLPDNRIVWLFGDTFLDTVYQDRSRPATGMVNNTLVVQDGQELTTLHGGTPENPTAFFTPKNNDEWYWPYDGTVKNNRLYIFLSTIERTGNGMWDFAFARTDLAVLSLPDLKLVGIRPLSNNTRFNFGACVLEEDDYFYLYGVEDTQLTKYAHVARIRAGNINNPIEFYNGKAWTRGMNQSHRLRLATDKPVDVSNQYSVIKKDSTYFLITHENLFSKRILVYSSSSPVGPWGNKKVIYETPEPGPDNNLYTYNTQAHPQFNHPEGKLLLSYNINSFEFLDLFENADNYRPRFIWASLDE